MARQTVPDEPMKGIWKPEKAGETREGVYLRMQEAKNPKYGIEYILQTKEGEVRLPCHELLQGKMAKLKCGCYVWVEYLGKSGKAMTYKVDYDPDHKPTQGEQSRIGDLSEISSKRGRLLSKFVNVPAGLTDKAFWDYAVEIFGSVGAASEAVERLKKDGLLVQDKEGMWKVTV